MDTIKGDEEMKKKALEYVDNYDSDEDRKIKDIVQIKEKPKWDCESIISTYSNLYNRPKVRSTIIILFNTCFKGRE